MPIKHRYLQSEVYAQGRQSMGAQLVKIIPELPKFNLVNGQAITVEGGHLVRHPIGYCMFCNEPYPKTENAYLCPKCHTVN